MQNCLEPSHRPRRLTRHKNYAGCIAAQICFQIRAFTRALSGHSIQSAAQECLLPPVGGGQGPAALCPTEHTSTMRVGPVRDRGSTHSVALPRRDEHRGCRTWCVQIHRGSLSLGSLLGSPREKGRSEERPFESRTCCNATAYFDTPPGTRRGGETRSRKRLSRNERTSERTPAVGREPRTY